MDAKKEIIDSMNIIAEHYKNASAQIMFGIIIDVENNKCIVGLNGTNYTIRYYGDVKPSINQKYPVFVPYGNMSLAFAITGNSKEITSEAITDALGYAPANGEDFLPLNGGTVDGNLTVAGDLSVNNGNLSIDGDLSVSGNLAIGGTLTTGGRIILASGSSGSYGAISQRPSVGEVGQLFLVKEG